MKKLVGLVVATQLMLACGAGEEAELETNRAALTRVTATRYTPQDLFRGLFFGRGPVAALLPQIYARGMPGAPTAPSAPDNVALAKRIDAEAAALTRAGAGADTQRQLRALSSAVGKDTLSAPELSRQLSVDRSAQAKAPASDTQLAQLMSAIDKADPTFFARFAQEIRSGDPLAVSSAIQESSLKLMSFSSGGLGRTSGELPIDGLAHGLSGCLDINLANVQGDLAFFFIDYDTDIVIDSVLHAWNMKVVFGDFGNISDPARHDAWMQIIATDLKA